MIPPHNPLYDEPAYGMREVAFYLKIPYNTLRYWLTGFGKASPIIHAMTTDPIRLSFLNLIECHVLSGMRKIYDLKLPKVRHALSVVTSEFRHDHPLISETFLTDRKDLFVERMGKVVNLSRPGQLALDFYHLHLERVAVEPNGIFRFFPFVELPKASEPKIIEINPMVGFGKPVISGTGISTAVVASRFHARESIGDLAAEYDCTKEQIEEAIRWEQPVSVAA